MFIMYTVQLNYTYCFDNIVCVIVGYHSVFLHSCVVIFFSWGNLLKRQQNGTYLGHIMLIMICNTASISRHIAGTIGNTCYFQQYVKHTAASPVLASSFLINSLRLIVFSSLNVNDIALCHIAQDSLMTNHQARFVCVHLKCLYQPQA